MYSGQGLNQNMLIIANLQLPKHQISNHLPPGDSRRCPQRWYVHRTGETVRIAEEKHSGNEASCVL